MSWSRLSGFADRTAALQNGLRQGRMAHAYLVQGAELVVLEEFAKTLAMVANCLNPPERAPSGTPVDCCDHCLSCQKIDRGSHPDVAWIRAESKSRLIRGEQIAELLQSIYLKPGEARYKVAVIVAADRMNPTSANKFLKTLEEPPSDSLLILLTTSPDRVLETLQSRCQRIHLVSESTPALCPEDQEWIQAFSEAAARNEGGLLERYRLLGVLLKRLTTLKSAIEERLSSESMLEKLDDLDPHYRARLETELAASVEAEYRRQRSAILEALLRWLRDVWLETLAVDASLKEFPDLVASTRTVASRLKADEAQGNLEEWERTQRLLETNVQEALALEVGLLKLRL